MVLRTSRWLIVVAAVAVLAALAVVGAGASQAKPLFQLPFPCGEEWDGLTYENHESFYGTPGNLAVDFNHERGNDFEAGRPVVASADGQVVRTADSNGVVELDHGGGWKTLYAHMATIAVEAGQSVRQGDQVGTVGKTATAGEHLHYEQALNGQAQPATFNGEAFAYRPTTSTPLISRNCPGEPAPPVPPARAAELAPTADYRFADTLASSVGAPPPLEELGAGGGFADDTVDGAPQRVYRFPLKTGLQLRPTCGVIWDGNYSMVLLMKLDATTNYRRLIDWRNGKSDRGLYVDNGRLWYLGQGEETALAVVSPNEYFQLVVTRDDATNQVATYVNGQKVLEFAYTTDIAVLDRDRVLRFFHDDSLAPGDDGSGAIARLRLYEAALTDEEVAALDRRAPEGAPEGSPAPSPPSCTRESGSETPSPSPTPTPLPTVTSGPPPVSCAGTEATVVASAAPEAITGTDGDDVIVAGGGADKIRSLGGNDTVCAGGGRDRVEGGPGRDVIYGNGSRDTLIGGPGRDRAVGGRGNDRCRAESRRSCER